MCTPQGFTAPQVPSCDTRQPSCPHAVLLVAPLCSPEALH